MTGAGDIGEGRPVGQSDGQPWACTSCGTRSAAGAAYCEACGAGRPAGLSGNLGQSAVSGPRVPTVTSSSTPRYGAAGRPDPTSVVPRHPGSGSAAHGATAGGPLPRADVAPGHGAASYEPSGTAPPGSGTKIWIVVGALGGIVAVLVVVLVVVLLSVGGNDKQPVAAVVPADTAPSDTTVSAGRVVQIPAQVPDATTTTTTIPADPDQVAADDLQQTADADKAKVEELVGYWVPQLDSKQYGMTNLDGVEFWDNRAIAENYQSYVARYPDALLVRSGDFEDFEPGYWVVLIPTSFASPDGALAWCTDQGFDRDHCYAKLVSHDPNVHPNAKLNP